MRIFLVRHGHRFYKPADPELTELGHKQADATGAHLKQFGIQKILSSPFRRAFQTAQGIAKHLSTPVEQSEKLKERLEYDPDHYNSFEHFIQEWMKSSEDRAYQPPTGLSSNKAGEQLVELIDQVREQESKTVLLVSHGGTIADFLRNLFAKDKLEPILQKVDDRVKWNLPATHDYLVNHCSITHVELTDDGWILHNLNDTSHLGEYTSDVVG